MKTSNKHPRTHKAKGRQPESATQLSLAQLKADPERLLSQHEVGGFLGKSPSWFERNRWAKTGPKFVKIGRSVYYRSGDVLDYIRAGTVETTQRAA